MQTQNELLTMREAMAALRRSRAGIYNLLTRGELVALKHGKMTCFRRSEIDRYLASLPTFQSRQQR
jgi:excisionase family DNA binding protein